MLRFWKRKQATSKARIEGVAKIVCAFVSFNALPAEQLPDLIESVNESLARLEFVQKSVDSRSLIDVLLSRNLTCAPTSRPRVDFTDADKSIGDVFSMSKKV